MTAKRLPEKKTRDKLLDVAEKMFAEHGFDAVSVRDITDGASVRLASVNYHFETKRKLFLAVVSRRATILSLDRKAALDAIHFTGLTPEEGVRALAHAFIDPMYQRSTQGDEGWKSYCRLIAQQAARRDSPSITAEFFDPFALELIAQLKILLPDLKDRHAHYAFQFMVGATIYLFTENGRLDALSGGNYSSHDLDTLCDDLARFVTGGVMAF